ncbi:MAG: hypothetical protein CMN30_34450 [Sandaracinus sp.]|nr:hypothetical protein [Sandaracinus sp.]
MSCSHDDRLLDLVLGELPAGEAAALRADAAECPHCQDTLARLEVGAALAQRMPIEEPPPMDLSLILGAAADKAASMAAERAKTRSAAGPSAEPPAMADPGKTVEPTAVAETDPSPSAWERLREWVAGVTLGPQLAMASVMVLVVSIGLWYLPNAGRMDEVARNQVTPDPEGEAISALPALEPLAEEIAEAEVEAGDLESDDGAGDRVALAVDGLGRERSAPARPNRVGASRGRAGRDDGLGALSAAEGSAPRARAQAAPAPEAVGAAREAAAAAPLEEFPLPTYGANAGGSAPAAPAPAPSSASASGSSYEQGVGSYRGGSYQAAEDELSDAVEGARTEEQRQQLPNAIHQLARSYRQQGECRSAITQYQNLLTNHPSYAQTPQALIEAADCLRQVGRLRDARTYLERAQRFASTRAAASRELVRIETLERATRRRSAAPSADFEAPAEAY